MKVLFITPYPRGVAPSQRFRFEHFLSDLEKEGVKYHFAPFFSKSGWSVLYARNKTPRKIWEVLKGFLRRVFLLLTIPKYDIIFLHREATPLGPPVIEWLITRVFRKKTVYDFDDAIWLLPPSQQNSFIQTLKWPQKVKSICRWAPKVSAGNDYLKTFADQHNSTVKVIPTVVDTENYHNRCKDQSDETPTLGWTGTHTTLPYLKLLKAPLDQLSAEIEFKSLVVIANQAPEFSLPKLKFKKWTKRTEIEDLLSINIGLMPLPGTEWARGKCGFKIIQYMSLGIVPVASAVGVNKTIISHGKDGYLCINHQQWVQYLSKLITSPSLRKKMGQSARKKIKGHYSVKSLRPTFKKFCFNL
jgi:glycosyltransferase involved in cell wall biosynthesis